MCKDSTSQISRLSSQSIENKTAIDKRDHKNVEDNQRQHHHTYHGYSWRSSTILFLIYLIIVVQILRGDAGSSGGIGNSSTSHGNTDGLTAGSSKHIPGKILSRLYKRLSRTEADKESSTSERDDTEPAVTLERGTIISNQVRGKELYDAYINIKEDYRTKAMSKSYAEQWEVLKETNDGIQISMLKHLSDPSCPYIRMIATIPAGIADVWDFLDLNNWAETMPKMDPFYDNLSILGEYTHRPSPVKPSVHMVLARKTTKRIVTFNKRDFTFVSVADVPEKDGGRVSGTVSVVTPRFPREAGYVRAFQDSVAFYEVMPKDAGSGEERSRITIVCRIDLNDSSEGGEGGAIPMWIYVKTIGESGVLSMQNMRREIRKRIGSKASNRDLMMNKSSLMMKMRSIWDRASGSK